MKIECYVCNKILSSNKALYVGKSKGKDIYRCKNHHAKKYWKDLEKGTLQKQTELNKVISDDLATKADIERVISTSKQDIKYLELKIESSKDKTIIWLSGIMLILMYGPIFIKYLASIIKWHF